jgi:hypothetical protein
MDYGPSRFRSLGDGQINFGAIFSKLTQYGYQGWAVIEWECALKHPEQGAAEGCRIGSRQGADRHGAGPPIRATKAGVSGAIAIVPIAPFFICDVVWLIR